jgi:hypothetical protein
MLLGQFTAPAGQQSMTVPQGLVQYPGAAMPVPVELAVEVLLPAPVVALAVLVVESPPAPPVPVVDVPPVLAAPPSPVVLDVLVSPPPLHATKPVASVTRPSNNRE